MRMESYKMYPYKEPKIGDIVLCWRPSLLLPEHYKAKVIDVIGNVWLVKPLRGIFKLERFVAGTGQAGIFTKK